MKYHKDRTAIKSSIEGLEAYKEAFRQGTLQSVPVHLTGMDERPRIWRKTSAANIKFRDEMNTQPLEVGCIKISIRAAVVDELTRHRNTHQAFVPLNGAMLAIVAPSMEADKESPDPARIEMIPVHPGQAIEVAAGTWHTLPYTLTSEILCLSIMHRENLDSYHDVRDLAAEGWIGVLEWLD